jgi:hypothetical protein
MTEFTNVDKTTQTEVHVEKPQNTITVDLQNEHQKSLWQKVKERLPFWKKEVQAEPEKVVEEIAAIEESSLVEEKKPETEFTNSLTNEPLTTTRVWYDKEDFKTETSRENEPSYNWRESWAAELKKNGVQNAEDLSPTWESLEQGMREGLVLSHYMIEVANLGKSISPENWEYIISQSEGFSVVKNSNFAQVHEGSNFIGVNLEVLMADVKSGDRDRLIGAFARLVHEAQHIELNKYFDGSVPLPEGSDPGLSQRTPDGYMKREKICWKREEKLYTELTGKKPERVWEDEDIQRRYKESYGVFL